MKIALIHDFLFEVAGSERVVEQILSLYPQADLFSVFDFIKPGQRGFLRGKQARTTFLQKAPLLKSNPARFLPYYVPLMPLAIEQLDLHAYDLVISSSHSVAKGVLTGPDQPHISYVHSPMRYAWDLQAAYLNQNGMGKGGLGWIARIMLSALRLWDIRTANGVDCFVANSHFVGRRIQKVYRRESTVIYPPVNLSEYPLSVKKEDYYLVVSRLVPYKQVGRIVEAFRHLPEQKLVVVGAGPELRRIKAQAGANVELRGFVEASELTALYQKAKAFIIAAEEDFGIAPLEAQACGTPVIAYGRGGAKETIRGIEESPRPTGLFFDSQEPQSIAAAVEKFEQVRSEVDPFDCRENAMRFSPERFRNEFKALVEEQWSTFPNKHLPEYELQLPRESWNGR